MRGGTSWLVRTAMEYFIAEFADDPNSALHRGLLRMRVDLTAVAESASLRDGSTTTPEAREEI